MPTITVDVTTIISGGAVISLVSAAVGLAFRRAEWLVRRSDDLSKIPEIDTTLFGSKTTLGLVREFKQLQDTVSAVSNAQKKLFQALQARGSDQHAIVNDVRETLRRTSKEVAEAVVEAAIEDVVGDTGSHRAVAAIWDARPPDPRGAPPQLVARRPTPFRGAPIPREDPPSDPPPPPPRRSPSGSSGGRR